MLRRLILLTTVFTPLIASAASLKTQLDYCAAIQADKARLACYDKLAQHSESQHHPVLTPTPPIKQHSVAKKQSQDKYYVTISSVHRNQLGHWIVKLSNGEIWRQRDDIQFTFNHTGRYYIENGFWNSHFLGNDDIRRRMRVDKVE